MNIRELALSLLLDFENSDTYVNLSLSSHRADSLTPEERGFLTHLLYTAVENKITYDYYISALAERSIDKIDLRTKCILRLGLCQIINTDSIPDFAAVNETVKLAKNKGERAFVNGVLRAALRKKDALPLPDRNRNFARYASVRYSLPIALVRHFLTFLSECECESLFDSFNRAPYTDLTVNTVKISVEDYADLLEKEGYKPTRVDFSPLTLRLYTSVNPKKLPGYDEGLFFIQDAASSLSAAVLGASSGERIIDVCSAPGGKSFALAILSGDKADVRSFDIHESKLSLISGGAERLSLSSVTPCVRDGLSPDVSLFGTADALLCDLPCSGLGVIAKKPDLRYRELSSLSELPDLQQRLLSASADYLKPGGRMVYSTCTLNKAENEEVVEKFLLSHPEFSVEDFSFGQLSSAEGRLTLYPHLHGTDGFFICKLRKHK